MLVVAAPVVAALVVTAVHVPTSLMPSPLACPGDMSWAKVYRGMPL